ncbi:Piso0_002603 [Millerozyma farinosa CBS 7064]|uniref:Piso0_002603 protein n=1 Tax=Pichia sorbitophila (strain ATCC MYA-4447 / BCRC 22081 / CBS 7064 / NBRC 10061 / NRRL Y-12695) TaxID=559304 RepID=G8YD21_PICSO|nr:Piso0_002603 [Millerozyma farinosa CBS 7064]
MSSEASVPATANEPYLFEGLNRANSQSTNGSVISNIIKRRSQIQKNDDSLDDIPNYVKRLFAVDIDAILTLSVKPGEPFFLVWYFISVFLPVITACLGPFANMISIVALVEHWRFDSVSQREIPEERYLTAINGLSLAFGIIGNISLLMNFSGRVKYLFTQCVSIISWFLASMLLLVVIIQLDKSCRQHESYHRTEGFWFGVITSLLYFICSIFLSVNFVGYKLDKYPATFNLDSRQRSLMIYTIVLAVWFVVGSICMGHLISGLTLGSSLYFCTVSILTIGLGDISPVSAGSRTFDLIYSLIGLLIMGLIIASIRSVVLSSASPVLIWHIMEKRRSKYLDEVKLGSKTLESFQAFDIMRDIRRSAEKYELNISLVLSIGTFTLFWLIGALVFSRVESGWSYFDAFYFCFLCLLTIGYGDFAPKSSFGRAFFVTWGICAVPLMTILISSIGDKLYDFAESMSSFLTKFTSLIAKYIIHEPFWIRRQKKEKNYDDEMEPVFTNNSSSIKAFPESMHKASLDSNEVDQAPRSKMDNKTRHLSTSESPSVDFVQAMHAEIKDMHFALNHLSESMDLLQSLLADCFEQPKRFYTHDQWLDFYKIRTTNLKKPRILPKAMTHSGHQAEFWLSEKSPLALPLSEPNYVAVKVIQKIKRDLEYLTSKEADTLKKFDDAFVPG